MILSVTEQVEWQSVNQADWVVRPEWISGTFPVVEEVERIEDLAGVDVEIPHQEEKEVDIRTQDDS